jgi:hypothetical protein
MHFIAVPKPTSGGAESASHGEAGAANLSIGRDLWISLSRYVSKPIGATAANGIRYMCKAIPFQQGIQTLCDVGHH